jgi:hypothetical protein
VSRHRHAIILIAALAGLIALPAIPAGARQIECDDGTYYVITGHSETRDVLERFRSENRSNSRTNFEWVVSKEETREYHVGGVAGGEWNAIFLKVKAEVNGEVVKKFTSSTSTRISGEMAPHSVATGSYAFRLESFDGYALDCVGGRERNRRPFSGEAPSSYVFSRDD